LLCQAENERPETGIGRKFLFIYRNRPNVKAIKKIVVAVFILVAIQLIPVRYKNPAAPAGKEIKAPPGLMAVLRRGCYDCHSFQTRRPWYALVAPVSWLLAHDIKYGRREVNFSLWRDYTAGQRKERWLKAVEEAAEGEMPPRLYLLMHKQARLTGPDLSLLKQWRPEEQGDPAERDRP
jgi:hypothetical protein